MAQQAAYTRLREFDADYTLYSDGSAEGGTERGGAGVVVTQGDPACPTVLETLRRKGSDLTSSYGEEQSAMQLGLEWIAENCTAQTKVVIATDSQSLCQALNGFDHEIRELRGRLIKTAARITVQWIPGHKGIAGNELADKVAKEATALETEPTPITFGSAKAKIKAEVKDDISTHERTARVYGKLSKQREAEVKSRADQVLLARIRSGHHWAFQSYHKLVDDAHDATCKECGCDLHDLELWLCQCIAHSHLRMRYFGTGDVDLDVLTERPTEAILFTRAALGQASSKAQDGRL